MNTVIVNDVQQYMDKSLPFGPWIHHATLKRGFKEYVVFRNALSNQVYIEEVEQHRATLILQKIEDDQEWQDLVSFAKAAGLLEIGKEVKVGPEGLPLYTRMLRA